MELIWMSVSKKIENEIKKLDETDEIKEIMMEILEEESKGLYNWKKKYEAIIDEYIKKNVLGEKNDNNK